MSSQQKQKEKQIYKNKHEQDKGEGEYEIEDVEVEHLVEQTTFYSTNKSEIQKTRDSATILLYFLFFIIISLSVWIQLEEGRFPFNVKFLADTAYSKNRWGTPLTAFGIVTLVSMTYILIRKAGLSLVDNQLYDFVIKIFKKNNLIVKLIKKKKRNTLKQQDQDAN